MKPQSGLGRYLLRSLKKKVGQKPRKKQRGLLKTPKSVHEGQIKISLSYKTTKKISAKKREPKILRLSQFQLAPAVKRAEVLPAIPPAISVETEVHEVHLKILPETLPEVLPEIQLAPPPAQQPIHTPIPVQLALIEPLQGRSITTQDLVRPSDGLKQSIEAFLLDQRSPHTRRAYGKDLKRFVQFLLARNFQQGTGTIETLNRGVVIAYKEMLLSQGLEHTTVDRHLATLRSFFKWLVDDGVLPKSPADGVRFMNPKRLSKTLGFSDEEVKKVLTLPDLHTRVGAQHYAILMVLFYCGLRRSELCELKTSNLGTERNQRVLRLRGKGNAERMIVIIPAVWSALQHYFRITRRDLDQLTGKDEYLFMPIRNNRSGVTEKPLDSSMIFYIVKKYARLAGIANRVSPHSCRATAISNARDHHVPDRAIQEFAGWASPDMITRYDKRKSSVEDSAAHGIHYGAEQRPLPQYVGPDSPKGAQKEQRQSSAENLPKDLDL